MIPVTSRKDQRLAVFGLGGSGRITAQALIAGGAQVLCWDDNPATIEEAASAGIPVADLGKVDFSELDGLVLSPGVPLTHPKPHWTAALATAGNIPVVGDVELFSQERVARQAGGEFIAITGTNGKSTTTALIAHVLATAGRDVEMGGNIGRAVLSLNPFKTGRSYVVECSSYQIDLAPGINPTIGLMLNLAPDHLDRHGTMENYAAIKARLVEASKVAIIGTDDPHSRAISARLSEEGHSVVEISGENPVDYGVYVREGVLYSTLDGRETEVCVLREIATLRGRHNAQNAAAAYAACHLAGLADQEIQAGFNSFPGLAHRMEIVGNAGKTMFVNDSKGTNADAAAMALSSFENIYWIAGGLAKEGGIEGLRPLFHRIRKAFLIGEAAPAFAATLGKDVAYEIAGEMDEAVKRAASAAELSGEEAVVLLSPACASFDQYRNFEIRGDAFRSEVCKLAGFKAYGGQET